MRVPPRAPAVPSASRCAHPSPMTAMGVSLLSLGHTVLDQVVHVLIVEQSDEMEGWLAALRRVRSRITMELRRRMRQERPSGPDPPLAPLPCRKNQA